MVFSPFTARVQQLVQTLWTRTLLSNSTFTIELVGTLGIQLIAFWIPSLLLLSLDYFFPSFSSRHKIQQSRKQGKTPTSSTTTTTTAISQRQITHCITTIALNQLLMTTLKLIELILLHHFKRSHHHHSFYRFNTTIPSLYECLLHTTLCILICEFCFYYTHRLLHLQPLYRKIHSLHHSFAAPIALSAQYAHPIEYLLSTILPLWLPCIVLNCHWLTCCAFWGVATLEAVVAHSGLRGLGVFSRVHEEHHVRSRVNFGTLGFLDWVHGTAGGV